MPLIRQGLGAVILDMNGMAHSGLPQRLLDAIAREIDKDEWIVVGVGSLKPVDCDAKKVSFNIPESEEVAFQSGDFFRENSEENPAKKSNVKSAKNNEQTITDKKVPVEQEPPQEPLQPIPPETFQIVKEPHDEEGESSCCQLIKSDTSPYVRPQTKEVLFSASVSIPGFAEVAIVARGTRKAEVMEPDFTRNCPNRCRDDEMTVPVSVDYDVSLRISGWVGIEELTSSLSTVDELTAGKLDFGPQIGKQGQHLIDPNTGTLDLKIGFDFQVAVKDGIILPFSFNCQSGTYDGIPQLNPSAGGGASTTPEQPGTTPGALGPFPVICLGKCHFYGAAAPDAPVGTTWRFTFTIMGTDPVTIFGVTDTSGEIQFGQTQPPTGITLPFELWSGTIADTCGDQPFRYSIRVTRTTRTSTGIFSATKTVSGRPDVKCPDEVDDLVITRAVRVGNITTAVRIVAFSKCENTGG